MDTGAGCPFVVSGSRSTSRREDWLSSTARAPETRVRGLTTHCRRDPQNPKGDKTKGLGLLSAWAPGRSEQSGRRGGSLAAAPWGWEALSLSCSTQRSAPVTKTHATRTPQETSAHALHHILSSDTCTPHTRETARRNSSDTLSTYGTYTHCAPRVPVHAVSQPSPSNLSTTSPTVLPGAPLRRLGFFSRRR